MTVAADGSYTMSASDVVFVGTYAQNQHKVIYKIEGYNPDPATLKAPAEHDAGYGDTVTVAPDLSYAGYTFTGWKADDPVAGVNDASFTMPDHNVTLYGFFSPLEDVPYKTIHYTQNLDGTYTKADEIPGSGTVDETVNAAERTFNGFTLDKTVVNATVTGVAGTVSTVTSGKVKADGSLTMHLFHTRNQYTVTYAYDGSVPTGAPAVPTDSKTYYHGETVTILGHAAQDAVPNHDFAGWHSADGTIRDTAATFVMPIGGMTLYGDFSIAENVGYTIEHYLELPTGGYPSTPNDTDTRTAAALTTIYAHDYQRAYPGYTYVADGASGVVSESTHLCSSCTTRSTSTMSPIATKRRRLPQVQPI